ncbi:MAG: tRNA dihydrouridine(20/20a) synthase DusA [Gammaproteobacteria bacterium]
MGGISLRRLISVAPMMDRTDRHCRYLLRTISKHAVLYTEMVTTGAILYGDRQRALAFNPIEHPVALQLGGSDPQQLAQCARIGEDFGYDEVNLNVGCPSNRVRAGKFGACLMAEPELVAGCVEAMKKEVAIPVTVKTRIGIDDQDSFENLRAFVEQVAAAGCGTFIIHARKAVLGGLSPKQNREIPPLRYELVHRLKAELPGLEVILNGGIRSLGCAASQLQHVDGVMLGREAYHNPYALVEADAWFYGSLEAMPSRAEVLQSMFPYMEEQLTQGVGFSHVTRHLLGLFQGQPGARKWRRHLSQHMYRSGAGLETLLAAARYVLPVETLTHVLGHGARRVHPRLS